MTSTVAICIASTGRTPGLERLLRSISVLEFRKVPNPHVRVVIADDTDDGLLLSREGEFERIAGVPTNVVRSGQRGIPHARNASVRAARAKADLIAFIDDDEVAAPSWLDELMWAKEHFDADGVGGPVRPIYPTSARAEIIQSGFFERPTWPTGTTRPEVYTGNALVDASVFEADINFDECLARSGGEDTELFRRLTRDGLVLVWSNDAIVWERIPDERLELRWMLRRRVRVGNTEGRTVRRHEGFFSYLVLRRCLIGLGHILIGTIKVAGSIGRKKSVARLSGSMQAATGVGQILGILGLPIHEYRRHQRRIST